MLPRLFLRQSLGEQTQVFERGDFIYAPGGTPHSFKGISDPPARVLVFDAPATAEQFFREVKRYPDDLRKVPEIGLRHQMRFRPMPASS